MKRIAMIVVCITVLITAIALVGLLPFIVMLIVLL